MQRLSLHSLGRSMGRISNPSAALGPYILNLSAGTGRRLNLSADAATLSSLYLMLERLTVEAPVAPERLAAWASERLSAGAP